VVSNANRDDREDGQSRETVADGHSPADLKTDQPHSARMYDYYLGGTENFPADREAAEQVIKVFPHSRIAARRNRAFMVRAIRYLAGEAGIRQFLDIGSGIPTSPNVHEVAQAVAPDARVVYTDIDPIVLTHSRALLSGSPAGRTAYLEADLRDVDRILNSPALTATLDLTRPVAVSIMALLHFLPDADDPYGIVSRVLNALPTGSYLILTHITSDDDSGFDKAVEVYRRGGIFLQPRGRAEIGQFFDGLDLVEPGVQIIQRWRPDGGAVEDPTDVRIGIYGGVARKP
jgi:S-adenosyl methyltransferase